MPGLEKLQLIKGLSIADKLDDFRVLYNSAYNIETLRSLIASNDHVLDYIRPLIKAALADKPDSTLIWNLVSRATVNVKESTPPGQTAPLF
ncbi:serine threonine- kinase sgk2 [Trichoderma arundinaceum]|uniref:Serine threonine-kinase sgk2 n=1 Tax=Trichoderma arundinaceum TaxID=490622 RepID=A0A395NWV9_TRIAR|nr:serine threonine- kinase sgk2 [Trichoderma arundinaceum]